MTSTIKKVGTVVKDIANGQLKAINLKVVLLRLMVSKMVVFDIVTSKLPLDIKDAVEKAKEQIKNGELKPTDGLSK